jgi:glutamyl-tRNA synthetase
MQEAGLEPMALLSLLGRIGTSQPVEPIVELALLADEFDFAHFGRAPAHFDLAEVEQLNARLLHGMSHEQVAGRLPTWVDEPRWLALRSAVTHLAELDDWRAVVDGEITPVVVDDDEAAFLATAADLALTISWEGDPWRALTGELKEKSGRKGRALFHPLRLALTGRDTGPEMGPLVRLFGQERTVARLRTASGRTN